MRFDFNDEQGEIKETAQAVHRLPLQARQGSRAGRGRQLRRCPLDRGLRARLARDRDRRGVRRPGPRAWSSWWSSARSSATPALRFPSSPTPPRASRSRPPAPTSRRPAWLPGIASGEGRGAAGELPTIAVDAEGAAVLVVLGDDGARSSSRPGDASSSRSTLIDATRALLAASDAAGGEALPGDVERRRRSDRRSRSRPSSSGSRSGRWRWRSSTPRSASSSSARSAPTRPSPTPARRCSTTSRRRAR